MVQAELLTQTDEKHFKRMLLDSKFGFQEKYNGHRLSIWKENGALRLFNREGKPSSKRLPYSLKQSLLSHPLAAFVIDGELVKDEFYIFDALILGDETLVEDAYEYREARYHTEFDGYSAHIKAVETARSPEEKRLLWDFVEATHGEGLVSKNMTAGYKQGRAEQHWKLKFIKECDCVVIGANAEGKDSVEIGMYDDRGNMHRVSGCSLRNKFKVSPGQVVMVEFLYATKNKHIVQPVLISVRNDKNAADCKLSQLEPYINKNWVKK